MGEHVQISNEIPMRRSVWQRQRAHLDVASNRSWWRGRNQTEESQQRKIQVNF